MKRLNQVFVGVFFLFTLSFIGVNIYMSSVFSVDGARMYKVDINRLQMEIKEIGIDKINLDQYSYVKAIVVLEDSSPEDGIDYIDFLEGSGSDYAIKNIDGRYYRFDYNAQKSDESKYGHIALYVNISMGIMAVIIFGLLAYIREKLIKPFYQIKDIPYELSKGNLTTGLKEDKNRFFGQFIWGLDLLREKLNEQRKKELSLQKEKKTLMLSISHDIKTPLSAIKLYSKALSRNLYDSEEKRIQIAESIEGKADEIETFVSDMIKAASDDFLSLEVENSEFYMDKLLGEIYHYYSEKLSLLKTELNIGSYNNCLIKGDVDRAIEVIQNIMENGIKYGDGKHIKISTSREEDCYLITILNSGCTLSKNELPHIFNSFWRGSNVKNKSGSGLGLYICRDLMRKMDGDIFSEIKGNEIQVTVVFRMV